MKKHLITFGAIAASLAPVITLVACGQSNKAATSNEITTPNKPSVDNKTVLFDVAKAQTTEDFIDVVLDLFKIKMPKPITELSPNTPAKLAEVKAYLENIDFTKNKILLVNGHDEYTLDFASVNHWIDELKKVAGLPFDKLDPTLGYLIGTKASTQAIDYTKIMLSEMEVVNLAPFTNMYDLSDKKIVRSATQEDVNNYVKNLEGEYCALGDTVSVNPPIETMIADHPYINLLKSYHNIWQPFVQSSFYKRWVVDKTFIVAKNDSKLTLGGFGAHANTGVKIEVRPGELYDQPNSLVLAVDKENKPTLTTSETSNFEFSFFYTLLNLKHKA